LAGTPLFVISLEKVLNVACPCQSQEAEVGPFGTAALAIFFNSPMLPSALSVSRLEGEEEDRGPT